MNTDNWKYVKALKSESSITDFEKKHSIVIPNALKELIKKNNSGRPPQNIFENTKGEEYLFKQLLSYNKDDLETIYDIIDHFEPFKKDKLLPFASEDTGDLFCINIETGQIVYWHHETDKGVIIADNLDAFLKGLSQK